MAEAEFDLFDGTPWAKRGPGRPEFRNTVEKPQLAERLLRDGGTQEEIARQLGCSVPTLRRLFSRLPNWNPRGLGPRKNGGKDAL